MSERVIPIATPQADATSRTQGGAPSDCPVDGLALDEVRRLLGDVSQHPDLLIEHLHAIQDHVGHLSAAHLAVLAHEMGLAQTEVFEVASFYHHFDFVKEGETAPATLTVRVCDGLACEMAGARELLARLPRLLGGDVRLIASPCLGHCEHAPAVAVGRNPVSPAHVEAVTAAVAAGATRPPPQSLCDYIDYAAYRAAGGYRLLAECTSGKRDAESVIRALEESGLRGPGGAGLPAARKWRNVLAEPGPRLMVVNIDQGEPGTFSDRVLLERDPHRLLEGVLIAAWAVDIERIYIHVRDDYLGCREILANEIESLLLELPLSGLPPIHLRRSAGAYICGEESAMIESIEGKRGLPRHRPPYVAQVGLFGRPTLEQNVETLYWVRDIVEKGAAWFTSHGRRERKGFRSFSVSGRVKKTGVVLAPAGVTARELIEEYCGGMAEGEVFKGYLPGGASGGILPASKADIPLDFGTLESEGCFIGSAAIVVLSDKDDMKDVALNLLRFFEDESCGQCTPCRVGTEKAVALMNEPRWDEALLADLVRVMGDASICGLGQAAMNPVRMVLKHFREDLTGGDMP